MEDKTSHNISLSQSQANVDVQTVARYSEDLARLLEMVIVDEAGFWLE